MPVRRRPLAAATTVLAAGLALAACGTPGTEPAAAPADDGTLVVVASTDVYGSIAAAVGGDLVTVESLITDPSADPHSYESTPADAAAVAEADVVVFNGGGYDEFMPRLLESAGGERTVLDVAELSGLVPEGEEAHAEGEEAHAEGEPHAEGEHGAFNEHFWYSLPTVRTLATDLAEALGAADAANAATYTANAQAFATEIDGLVVQVEAAGASAPGGEVAVTEPVPGYLVEQAGLTDVTPPEFSEAVEEDTDPAPAVVADTLALFGPGGTPLRALIVNAQTETPTTEQVRAAADSVGVPVVEMTETLPEGQTSYTAWMGAQIQALTAALNPV